MSRSIVVVGPFEYGMEILLIGTRIRQLVGVHASVEGGSAPGVIMQEDESRTYHPHAKSKTHPLFYSQLASAWTASLELALLAFEDEPVRS